jgi:hypothetical protein
LKEATKDMNGRKAAVIATASVLGIGLLGSAALAAFAPAPSESFDSVPGLEASANGPKPGSPDKIKAILDALVAKNVITQAQADAIVAALKDTQSEKDRGDFLRRVLSGLFEQSATYLGMTQADLKAKLPGTSLGALADANAAGGKSRDGLVRTLTKAATDAIDKALADKKITQEQADKAKPEVLGHVMKFVDQTYPKRVERKPVAPRVEAFIGDAVSAAREYLGISAQDLMKGLREGKSLGEIADATAGKTRTGLVATITNATSAKIDKAAQDKKITAEQATQLKAGVGAAVTLVVDRKMTIKPRAVSR